MFCFYVRNSYLLPCLILVSAHVATTTKEIPGVFCAGLPFALLFCFFGGFSRLPSRKRGSMESIKLSQQQQHMSKIHAFSSHILNGNSEIINCVTSPFPSLGLVSTGKHVQVNPTNTSIPAYPVLIEGGGTTSLAVDTPGSVGILLNGVAIFR